MSYVSGGFSNIIFMKKILILIFIFSRIITNGQSLYKRSAVMIPMRDGIKLFTVIYSPVYIKGQFPFMIERTPYGAFNPADTFDFSSIAGYADMAKDGYIFVFQDIRGKYKSEGKMEMNRPIYHKTNPSAIDESTDTYDAIDWLVKNIPGNN